MAENTCNLPPEIVSSAISDIVEHDLLHSIDEEYLAIEIYMARICRASKVGDTRTIDMYQEIMSDEIDHKAKITQRLIELKGKP